MSNLSYRKNIIEKYNISDTDTLIELLEGSVSDKIQKMEQINKGDAGTIYKLQLNKSTNCILKLYNTNDNDNNNNNNTYFKIIKDIIIHNKIRVLIINNICPNFIYYYYSNLLLSNFLLDKKNKTNIYLIMEYCNGTLVDFLKPIYPLEYYESMVFQICISVLCMQKYLKMLHNDFHSYNITFKEINKDCVFNYNINNINYYVPSFGFLFVVIDFEKSILIDLESESDKNKIDKINKNYDFKSLKYLHHRPIKILLKEHGIVILKDFLNLINKKYLDKITEILEKEKKTSKYINHNAERREKLLFRTAFHYAIENNYLDFSNNNININLDLINKIKKLKELTENIFQSEEPIEKLLNKYFKKYQEKIKFDKTFNIKF